MASDTPQPGTKINETARPNARPAVPPLPDSGSAVEQNVIPVVNEAQKMAARTSFSGRKAVSRGTMFLAFYLWLLSGAVILYLVLSACRHIKMAIDKAGR